MQATGFIPFLLMPLGCALAGVSFHFSLRLAPDECRSSDKRWLLIWFAKGLAVPALIWAGFNLGLFWFLPPFMPSVSAAMFAGDPWVGRFFSAWCAGLFVISSYWAALTLAWTLYTTSQRLRGSLLSDFKSLCFTAALGTLVFVVVFLWVGRLYALGLAVFIMLAPVAGQTGSLLRPKKLPPMYGRAIARIKFGKYAEAEWEIIRQLEQHEDDYEGWMMLATLYAETFRDLPEAEQTVMELCDQPKTRPSEAAVALHKLADWHLSLNSDPDSARRALEVIGSRFPNTHLARMAATRIQQLPATRQEVEARRVPEAVPLPALGDSLDEDRGLGASPPIPKQDAARMAAQCVERLKRDPNNIEARVKFARLMAEHLGQPTQAIEQIRLLLALPGESPARKAEWLGLVAAWLIKYAKDLPGAREVLNQIITDYPDTPQALAARRRLQILQRNTLVP